MLSIHRGLCEKPIPSNDIVVWDLYLGESLFIVDVGVKQHMSPGGHQMHHHTGTPYKTPAHRTDYIYGCQGPNSRGRPTDLDLV